jgi:FKBP-type peptidyl-prolyl cis-trans isomerase/thiol-disulfide isomerase/thioredoxin
MNKIHNMIRNLTLITLILISFIRSGIAQEFTPIKAQKSHSIDFSSGLKVGDTIPNIVISNLLNNGNKSIDISTFKKKILLIDFWSIYCTGCVLSIPKLDKMQEKYGKDLKILLATQESKKLVKPFWESNNYTRSSKLPTVIEDTQLIKLFPHNAVTHGAWIYKGKVVAITGADYIDENAVDQILSGKKIDWLIKNDSFGYNGALPLFTVNSSLAKTSDKKVSYSAIRGFKDSVSNGGLSAGSAFVKDSTNKTIRTYLINSAIYSSYALAINHLGGLDTLKRPLHRGIMANQTIWEVSDRGKYQYLNKVKSGYEQDWMRKYGICYESVVADSGQSEKDLYAKMVMDLNLLLGLEVRWVRRSEQVYILKRGPINAQLIVNDGIRVSELSYLLNSQQDNPYVYTDDKSAILLPKSVLSITDLTQLALFIKPYGLELIKENRVVHKLLFKEVENLVPDIDLIIESKVIERTSTKYDFTKIDSSKFFALNKLNPGIISLSTGLQYLILKPGIQPMRKISPETKKVIINYTGMLLNGTVFESSLSNGLSGILQIDDMIEGWRQAIPLMDIGSKWRLFIPSKLAYGTHTGNGKFPPNSALIFDMELVGAR